MNLKSDYRNKVIRAVDHLEYSFAKVQKLESDPAKMDEEILETWESFTARSSPVVDLFLTKYVKACVLINDPGFDGSLRDIVDQGEKLGLVEDADSWMIWRGFRNSIAHDYQDEELKNFLEAIRDCSPKVIAIKGILIASQ